MKTLMILAVSMAVLTAGPFVALPLAGVDATPLSRLPKLPDCKPAQLWDAPWTPEIAGADVERRGSYDCGSYRLHVVASQFVEQKQGKEAVNANNAPLPREWTYRGFRVDGVIGDAEVVQVPSQAGSLTAAQWYAVGDDSTPVAWQVKAWELWNAARFASTETVIFVVAVDSATPASMDLLQSNVERIRKWHAASRG